MAVFDLEERRMCLRIVYDGVAGAGKTTNLQQLSHLFAAQRTTPLHSPAEIEGRTLYFDWMQIYAGVICGFPLLCQVITVPGQVVLTERRRHLLASADAVVYVCDSSTASVEQAKSGLAVLDEVCRSRAEPPLLVLQANKQDQGDAVSGNQLAQLLGRPDMPVVEAIARDGMGVVDTFITAVRQLTRALQARSEKSVFRVPVRPAESARAVLARLEALEVDPEWAAEMLLEEASRSFAVMNATASAPTLDVAPPRVSDSSAPFPRADVPTGFVWPAHTGRSRLSALAIAGSTEVPVDADGHAKAVVGGFQLTTSESAHYHDAEAARQAVVRAARERTQLGTLLAPETVLVVQPANEGESWLWTVAPALPSVKSWIDSAPESERATRIESFATAVSDAIAYTSRHGVALDTTASSYGVEGNVVRYLGDLVAAPENALERMVDSALKGLASVPEDVRLFAGFLERELARRSLGVAAHWSESASASTQAAWTARPPAKSE